MPAVSDSGPLIHLAQIEQIRLLKDIFGKVTIVPRVKAEVVDEGIMRNYPDATLTSEALKQGYILVSKVDNRLSKQATRLSRQENISQADSETLILARRLGASLLTDEKVLSMLAGMFGLDTWNTWTVLLEALRKRLIEKAEIDEAIKELGEMRHKLSQQSTRDIREAAERIEAKQA